VKIRKSVIVPVTQIVFLSYSLNAFAACDQERSEFNHFDSLCSQLTATAEVVQATSALGGSIFAFATFGASVLAGGLAVSGAIAARDNACRIRAEKLANLNVCMDHHQRLQDQQAEAEQVRLTRIREIRRNFNQRQIEVDQAYTAALEELTFQFQEAGSNDEDRAEFENEKLKLLNSRNERIRELNAEEDRQVGAV
jgi:Spy/CpxP family protein refolding chaperone